MSDLFGNHIVGFPTRRLKCGTSLLVKVFIDIDVVIATFEPPRGKTNNVVSEQVRHKPTCTSTEAG